MADTKISALAAVGTLHADDLLVDVDVHDTSMAASGTDKKLTITQLTGALTGDVIYTGLAGVIANSAVTLAKQANFAASSLMGNPTGSPAAPSAITLAANSGLTFTGTTLATTSTTTTSLFDASFGSTQGDTLYRSATAWAAAGPGTAGQVWTTGGASANPGWASTGINIDSHFGVITADTQSTSTWTLNAATSDSHTITLTQSITTLTITNGQVGQVLKLRIIQGGSGSYTITWPANTKWPASTAPTLTTTVGGIDVITLWITSASHYDGFVVGLAMG